MNEFDTMRLLADANPVRVQELAGLAPPDPAVTRHRSRRRLFPAAAVVAGAIAASLIGVFVLGGQGSRPAVSTPNGSGENALSFPLISVEHPLALGAKVVTLAEAKAAFGPGLILPETPLVGPSDLGPVWMHSSRDKSTVTVALTFPKQGMFIQYIRRPYGVGPTDLRSGYASIAREDSYFHVLDVNGIPALAADQNSDQTGHNFGAVIFAENRIETRVFGHYDQATLESVAKSIIDQEPSAPPTSELIPAGSTPIKHLPLRDASATFGARVVLPDRSLVERRGARVTAAGRCPPGSGRAVVEEFGCAIYISLPRSALNLVYERAPAPWRPRLWRPKPSVKPFDLDGVRATEFRATRLSIKPAVWVLTFAIGDTRVEVSGDRDLVRTVGRSMIDRSK